MAVLPIYTDGSPVLRKKAQPVTKITDDIIQLIMDMFETMRKANGIGLAANQVGILQRIIVIDVSEVEGCEMIKPVAFINPEVIADKERIIMEEGCLSVPDVRDEVERAETISLRYRDTNFKVIETELTGMFARVVLHEIDHLDGILFVDRLSPEKRQVHLEELKKIHQGEIEVDYPVVTAVDANE
jgi:peptide deformylase